MAPATPAGAASLLGSGGDLLGLGQAAQDDVALELRQVVDEQQAVQVVDLVLDALGEQAVGLEFTASARPRRGSAPAPAPAG